MCLPKVSVIVPVYNVAPYIERCWLSIKQQTYRNLEVIFVDDCGTDDSVSILEGLIKEDAEIDCRIVHHERNRGLSAARNTGLSAATGEYVYFLDSDDDIAEDCIESLVRPVASDKVDVVVADYKVIGPGGYLPLSLPEGLLKSNEEVLKTYADGKWYVMAWNKLCRREFLIENNLWFKEGLIHEDVLWTFMVACKAQNLYAVKKKLYNYYIRSASIMTSMSIEKDLGIYLQVFGEIAAFAQRESRLYGSSEYALIEGKKSGILYSLLQKGEVELYKKAYMKFRTLPFASPVRAYREGVVSLGYLMRDLHYMLPECLGAGYKRLFYLAVYKWRCKKIDGAVWG